MKRKAAPRGQGDHTWLLAKRFGNVALPRHHPLGRNQNNLPFSQPFQWSLSTRGAERSLSTGLASQRTPDNRLPAHVRAVDRQKGDKRSCYSHQPVAVAERHGRGFSQARHLRRKRQVPSRGSTRVAPSLPATPPWPQAPQGGHWAAAAGAGLGQTP